MRLTINYPVDIDSEIFDVRFTAECYMTNDGIGYHDYCGVSSFDAGRDYLAIEDIEWDEFLYTLEENNEIRKITKTYDFRKTLKAEYLNAIEP